MSIRIVILIRNNAIGSCWGNPTNDSLFVYDVCTVVHECSVLRKYRYVGVCPRQLSYFQLSANLLHQVTKKGDYTR
jgi:hypothetical protein